MQTQLEIIAPFQLVLVGQISSSRFFFCKFGKQFSRTKAIFKTSLKAEWKIMKTRMIDCGIEESKIKEMMRERFVNFEKAVNEFKQIFQLF